MMEIALWHPVRPKNALGGSLCQHPRFWFARAVPHRSSLRSVPQIVRVTPAGGAARRSSARETLTRCRNFFKSASWHSARKKLLRQPPAKVQNVVRGTALAWRDAVW